MVDDDLPLLRRSTNRSVSRDAELDAVAALAAAQDDPRDSRRSRRSKADSRAVENGTVRPAALALSLSCLARILARNASTRSAAARCCLVASSRAEPLEVDGNVGGMAPKGGDRREPAPKPEKRS